MLHFRFDKKNESDFAPLLLRSSEINRLCKLFNTRSRERERESIVIETQEIERERASDECFIAVR